MVYVVALVNDVCQLVAPAHLRGPLAAGEVFAHGLDKVDAALGAGPHTCHQDLLIARPL